MQSMLFRYTRAEIFKMTHPWPHSVVQILLTWGLDESVMKKAR